MHAVLSLRGINRVFLAAAREPVWALQGVDLDINAGEFFAIIGPSGCGKSTLMDIVAGLLAPSEGEVIFEGKRVSGTVPGGMRQRVCIARTLVLRPRLILLDEPFAALDQQTRLLMGEELLRLWRETGATVVLI